MRKLHNDKLRRRDLIGASALLPLGVALPSNGAEQLGPPPYTVSINIEIMFPKTMPRAQRLEVVAAQGMTAGSIAANFDTARPTVSKHLQILTECELLKQEQCGREVYYHINAKNMKQVADFIEPFRQMWEDRFNKLETIMKTYNQNNDGTKNKS